MGMHTRVVSVRLDRFHRATRSPGNEKGDSGRKRYSQKGCPTGGIYTRVSSL